MPRVRAVAATIMVRGGGIEVRGIEVGGIEVLAVGEEFTCDNRMHT